MPPSSFSKWASSINLTNPQGEISIGYRLKLFRSFFFPEEADSARPKCLLGIYCFWKTPSEIQPELNEAACFSADAFSGEMWLPLPYSGIQESHHEYCQKISVLYWHGAEKLQFFTSSFKPWSSEMSIDKFSYFRSFQILHLHVHISAALLCPVLLDSPSCKSYRNYKNTRTHGWSEDLYCQVQH